MQLHAKQHSPFPERLKLPFSSDEILSGFEEIVSSGTDQFTAGVKTDPDDAFVTTYGCSKKQPQILAKHQKGGLLHLLKQTVPPNILLPVRMCRGDSASTTGTLDPDVETKMPSTNKLQ